MVISFLFEPFLIGWAVIAGLAFVLVWRGTRNGRSRQVLSGVILLGVVLAWIAIDRAVVTASESANEVLNDMVEGVRQGNPDRVINGLSPTYRHGEWSYEQLAGSLRRELGNYKAESVSINGRRTEMDGDNVLISFVATTSGSYRGFTVAHYPMRMTVTFRREGDSPHYRVAAIDRFEPITNTSQKIPLLSR